LIIGLCVAKNEADIIEAMVRHNLSFLDRLHMVDNDSSDGTLGIVQLLASEFPSRLTWSTDERPGHMQKVILNELLTDIASGEDIAHVVLLDADEFIRAPRDAFRSGLFAADAPVLLPWVTYVPTRFDDSSEPNPALRIGRRRRRERPQHFKVTVPGRLIGRVQVKAGSRYLKGPDVPDSVVLAEASLAHFPVRSPEQLMSKVLIGSWSVRARGPLKGKEAYHWHALAERILSGDLIREAELHAIALTYAADKEVGLVRDPLPSVADGRLRYTRPGSELLIRNLIAFAEICVQWREANHPAGPPPD